MTGISRRSAIRLGIATGAGATTLGMATNVEGAEISEAMVLQDLRTQDPKLLADIDAATRRFDATAYKEGGELYLAPAEAADVPNEIRGKICSIYRRVEPILEAVVAFPFIPKQWKGIVVVFIGVMKTFCQGVKS